MSAAALIFGADSSTPRQTLAFSLSLLLHLTFASLIFLSIRRDVASPPLEISIYEGPPGPASPPPGERSAAPGPVGPQEAHPIEPPPIAQVEAPHLDPPARPHPDPKAIHVERRVAKSGRAPTTKVLESVQSGVAPRETPKEEAPSATTATARPTTEQVAGSVAAAGPQASGDFGASVAAAMQPGPGGRGSGWTSGSGGAGGGGTGRGGFSLSGAGAGGAGRSYASIWESTQRYLARLRLAYNNALRNHTAVHGVIVVRYEILGSGVVGEVAMVSSQLRDPHFEEEVLNQIRGWRYTPEPTGTVIVTWPLSFRPPT